MSSKFRMAALLAAATGVLVAQEPVPFQVRPGLWEMISSSERSGPLPIPASLLSKLSPEQRAKLQVYSAAQSKPSTYKYCLTKEKLDTANLFHNHDSCKGTILSSTTSKISIKLQCVDQLLTTNGSFEFEAISPESVKGAGHATSVAAGSNAPMIINATYSGKWIGPDCGDVK